MQIVLTIAEHHSAIVPWQFVAQKTGAVLKFVSLNQDEVPDIDMLKKLLSTRTKLVVVHHVSNVLGMSLPPLCVLYTPFRCLFTGLKNLASVRLIYVSACLI